MKNVTDFLPIQADHGTGGFDCDVEPLNLYLKKFALQNHRKNSSRTYVALANKRIVGYFSLAYGSVEHDAVPPKISQGFGRYPVPVLVLARLAVDKSYQKMGLGSALLKQALLKALSAAEIAGLRAIVVHIKDDNMKHFYEKFGFSPSPFDAFHLFLLLKDIQKILS
jgi:predicted N-acetyltransferase YhbS